MARIAGVDIPNDKRVVISLTYVYGIGLATSKKILAAAGISEDVRVRDLTSDQEDAIRREVDAIKVEGDLLVQCQVQPMFCPKHELVRLYVGNHPTRILFL